LNQNLPLKFITAVFENPAIQDKLQSLLKDDSSVLDEMFSPEQRSRVLDSMSESSSLEKRSLWNKMSGNETVLIEYDEHRANEKLRARRGNTIAVILVYRFNFLTGLLPLLLDSSKKR
jgi:hypothetical protein